MERRKVALWTEGAARERNGCLHFTNWAVFKDSCTSLDAPTHTVVSYITFPEEMMIPRKTIIMYPYKSVNHSRIPSKRGEKKVYYHGDITQQREAQKLVRKKGKLGWLKCNNNKIC